MATEPPADWHPELSPGLRRGHWEERYDAVVMTCAACAARDRKHYVMAAARERNDQPPPGVYVAILDEQE